MQRTHKNSFMLAACRDDMGFIWTKIKYPNYF